jgi:hypothetical protein
LDRKCPNRSGRPCWDRIFLGLLDGTVAAYDDTTLDELWKINVGSGFSAPPMTFEVNGKQYLAIASGLTWCRTRRNQAREVAGEPDIAVVVFGKAVRASEPPGRSRTANLLFCSPGGRLSVKWPFGQAGFIYHDLAGPRIGEASARLPQILRTSIKLC